MESWKEIQLIDLLCQREAELVRVACAEEAIRNLLGGATFPFTPPPDLPSRRKVSAKAKSTQAPTVTPKQAFPGLRELLRPRENAFRLVYRYNGEEKESFQADTDFLKQLIKFPCEAFQLQRIETVFFRKLTDWEAVETLYTAPEETAEDNGIPEGITR